MQKTWNTSILPKFLTNPDSGIYLTNKYVVLDIETTNIDKGSAHEKDNRLVTYSLLRRDMDKFTITCGNTWLQLFSSLEKIDEHFIIGHGLKFELKWMVREGFPIEKFIYYDTLLGDYVIAGNRTWDLDLDTVAKRYSLKGKYSPVSNLIKAGICPSTIDYSSLSKYCTQDVHQTHEVFLKQRGVLQTEGLLNIFYLRCLSIPVVSDIEYKGMYLDKSMVFSLASKFNKEYSELIGKLNSITGGINMASPQQVAKFLYEDLGFKELTDRRGNPSRGKPTKQFPQGAPKTDEATILLLKATSKVQKEFLSLKIQESKLRKKITSYINRFMEACTNNNSILYGAINQSVSRTQRLTSSNPNLQNIDRELKKVITSRIGKIRSGDYKQLEFRVAAFLAQDTQALKDIKNNHDVHKYTAAVLTDAGQVTNRQDAKAHCFPLETKILTPLGWKKYNEISIGDEVINYNSNTKTLVKDIIIDYTEPHKQEVIEMRNKHNWKVQSTLDHRWYGEKLIDWGSAGKVYEPCVVRTKDVNSSYKIITSANYISSGDISQKDATRIAWLWSAGSIGESRIAAIQKKHITEVEFLFKEYIISYNETNGCRDYNLSLPKIRKWLNSLGNPNKNTSSYFVLSLSDKARKAWLNTICLAEGTRGNYGAWRIVQNSGSLCEAIKLAGFLCGYDIRTTKVKMKCSGKQQEQIILRTRPYVTGQGIIKESKGIQDVWCVTTNNRTVVILQGDTISISGQTFKPLYGGTSGTKAEITYYNAFKQRYKKIAEMQARWIQEVLKTKFLVTITGLKFYFPDTEYTQSGYIINTSSISNYPVQMFATADIAPTGTVILWHLLKANKCKSFIINEVHDSIIAEEHIDEDLGNLFEFAMSKYIVVFMKNLFGIDINYPLEIEQKVGSHWDYNEETNKTEGNP